MSAAIFIDAISYELGEPVPITLLPQCQADLEAAEALREEGYHCYLDAGRRTADELAFQVARRSLELDGSKPSEIDCLVLCSDSLGDQRDRKNNSRVHALSERLGLEGAYPIGISQSTCGNFCSALRVAAALIKAGEVTKALLVVADTADAGKRVMDANSAVLSDGAASCVLSSTPGRFRLRALKQLACHRLAAAHGPNDKLYLALDGFQRAFSGFSDATQSSAASWLQLIPNNYGASLLSTYTQLAGLSSGQVYMGNIAKNAHVFSADNLINLLDFSRASALHAGQTIAMMSNGPANWGFAALSVES